MVPQMENETRVTLHFPLTGESEEVRCTYNPFGEVAIVGDMDAIITMSPADACRLSKMLRHAAEDALADLQEALGVA